MLGLDEIICAKVVTSLAMGKHVRGKYRLEN